MSIKYNLGKLTLAPSYEEFVEREIITSSINLLNIELEHLIINATLPFHQRDPFDRIIIAQSMAENLPIITVDSVFKRYSLLTTHYSLLSVAENFFSKAYLYEIRFR